MMKMVKMMKMSESLTSCCVVLVLALTSVSAVKKVDSIKDLKHIDFGRSVPKHSLLLLYWFANAVEIDRSDVVEFTFDPDSGEYGSHPYNNREKLLDPLPNGYRYYTVGNLNQVTSEPFPWYVTDPPTEYEGDNRDRIIIRVREQNLGWRRWRIDRVYITQHYQSAQHRGSMYDSTHTYMITTDLLRQIQEFSEEEDMQSLAYGSNADDYLLQDLTNIWGDFTALGLLLFIVIQERPCNRRNNRPRPVARRNTPTHISIHIPEDGHNPRQDYGDDDTSNICIYVCAGILMLLIFIVAILYHFFPSVGGT